MNSLNQITSCYIEKNMMLNDRDCIVKDPTADVLEVISVIDRRLKRAWNTELIHLKILSYYDSDDGCDKIRYMYEIDRIYEKICPPSELETLLIWAYVYNKGAWVAFLWFCERQANRFAASAASAAAYAAAYDEYAEYAEYAAASAAYAASAAAEIEQIVFLRKCLGGNQP